MDGRVCAFLLLFFFFPSVFQKKQDRSPLRGTLLRAAPGAEAHILSEGFPEAFRNTAGGSTPCAVTHRYDDDLFTPVLDDEIVENGIWDQESGPTLGPKCLEYSIPSPIFYFFLE